MPEWTLVQPNGQIKKVVARTPICNNPKRGLGEFLLTNPQEESKFNRCLGCRPPPALKLASSPLGRGSSFYLRFLSLDLKVQPDLKLLIFPACLTLT